MIGSKHFRMSVFSAVSAIRNYLDDHPEVDARTAAKSIPTLDADFRGADFELGLELHYKLSSELSFANPAEGFRGVISSLIAMEQPLWVRFAPSGRERLRAALTGHEHQCLRSADLFEEPPSEAVVTWWDRLSLQVQSKTNESLLLQGREAERLSLEYETKRLINLNIQRVPRWTAIEDNWAGFDIQSYSQGAQAPVSRLIEVKSSYYDPPRIILSRNEWNTAESYGSSYIFHIWEMQSKTLIEKTVQQIGLHIPQDNGQGEWTEVEITIS